MFRANRKFIGMRTIKATIIEIKDWVMVKFRRTLVIKNTATPSATVSP